jgi:hypothetical protein
VELDRIRARDRAVAEPREYRNLETPERRNVGTSEDQTGNELSENPRKMSENIKK